MTQSNFSLADLISLLIGIVFGFICFLGANFYTYGDTNLSIGIAVIISLLMVGTSMGAIRLKRTNKHFKIRKVWEILMVILFTGFTIVFTYFVFSHYFVVIDKKDEIQTKLTTNLNQVDRLYKLYQDNYERRKENYESALKSAVLNYKLGGDTRPYYALGFNPNKNRSNKSQIRSFLNEFQRDLFPDNFNSIMKKDSIYVSNSRGIISNWKQKPIGTFEVIKNLDTKIQDTKSKLINLSKQEPGYNKYGPSFQPTTSIEDVEKLFTTTSQPTILSLCLGFIAWLLMLLSYFTSRRSTKSKKNKSHQGQYDISI